MTTIKKCPFSDCYVPDEHTHDQTIQKNIWLTYPTAYIFPFDFPPYTIVGIIPTWGETISSWFVINKTKTK